MSDEFKETKGERRAKLGKKKRYAQIPARYGILDENGEILRTGMSLVKFLTDKNDKRKKRKRTKEC